MSNELLQTDMNASSNNASNVNKSQNKDILAETLANITSILKSKKQLENGSNPNPPPLDVPEEHFQENMNASSNNVTNVDQSGNKDIVAGTLANTTRILNSTKTSELNKTKQGIQYISIY